MKREIAGVVLLASVAACDPCSGVSRCGATQAVHVEGRIVDPVSGASIEKAAVVVSLADGPSATSVTDEEGLFAATIGVGAQGSFTYDLAIDPPADSAFVIRGLTCDVGRGKGDGCAVGRVVSRPYFWDFIRLAYRDAEGQVVPNAQVTFRRKSGARFYGKRVVNQAVVTSTDAPGYMLLFGLDVFAADFIPLVGDLIVKLPAPLDSTVVPDFVLEPRAVFPEERPPYELQVGPALRSAFVFYRGSAGTPAASVKVRFTRTSGIPIGTTGLTAVSDSTGTAVLRPRPLVRGQLVGDLLVEPAAPAPSFTITGLVLTTRDDDSTRVVLSRDLEASAVSSLVRKQRR